MKIKEIIAEKLNPDTLSRGFNKEKDMGWYKLVALGDFKSRGAEDPPTLTIRAFLKDGRVEIGELHLKIAQGAYLQNNPGAEALVAAGVDVDPEYQRKGVGSSMYQFAKELGNDVIASFDQSDDAKAMWAGMQAKGQATAQGVAENFADGKVKGKSRPGRVKRAGASCSGSVTSLRQKAKQGGERGKMYHWCANMKAGRQK